jgi:enoyl-[acyl-carrier-protein] reductase (NADH)
VSIEDVGAAVAFLGMDATKLITGETLYITPIGVSTDSHGRSFSRIYIRVVLAYSTT